MVTVNTNRSANRVRYSALSSRQKGLAITGVLLLVVIVVDSLASGGSWPP